MSRLWKKKFRGTWVPSAEVDECGIIQGLRAGYTEVLNNEVQAATGFFYNLLTSEGSGWAHFGGDLAGAAGARRKAWSIS